MSSVSSRFAIGLALAFPLCVQAGTASAPAAPGNAELYQIIQSLQAQVQALKAQLDARDAAAAPAAGTGVEALTRKLETQQAQIEALADVAEAAPAKTSSVHFGGYGEMYYKNLSADDPSFDVEELDFARFVLFTGFDFSKRIRFASELEVEHVVAADGAGGEVELEQAYLQFDLNDRYTASAGLMLLPVGIINETHEPTTFYGVVRNDVESIVIPTTWWAGGVGLSARFSPGLQWDVMVHEGLKIPTLGGNAFAVRAGRQKTSNADASDLAYTTRLRYTGIPGLELAGSLQYQTDASQTEDDGVDSALFYTAHAVWSRGAFGLRALYGGWSLSGDAIEAADADRQNGWYVEPSYRLLPDVGLYARYEDVEGARLQDRFTQWEGGLNYYPHPQVVLKADYRARDFDLSSESGRQFDGFDLGLGYQF